MTAAFAVGRHSKYLFTNSSYIELTGIVCEESDISQNCGQSRRIPTFILQIKGSDLSPDMGLGLYSVLPGSGWYSSLNWATTTSFHMLSKLLIVH
jgi:hypothetical protein